MITPNFNILLWVLLISISIGAICKLIAGCTKMERPTTYGYGDALAGLIEIIIVIYIIIG